MYCPKCGGHELSPVFGNCSHTCDYCGKGINCNGLSEDERGGSLPIYDLDKACELREEYDKKHGKKKEESKIIDGNKLTGEEIMEIFAKSKKKQKAIDEKRKEFLSELIELGNKYGISISAGDVHYLVMRIK